MQIQEEESVMYVVNNKGNIIPIIAGIFVLISSILGAFVSPYWLFFTAFVGINLIVSGATGFCLMEKIVIKLGVKEKQTD